MTKPSVSVVIPTYNRTSTLREAVLSAATQRLDGVVEVIVIDDGSTDGTSRLVHETGGVRYARIPHSGIGAARNEGLRLCRGDYIAFLDSDDVWHSGKLAREIALLDAYSAQVISTDARYVKADSVITESWLRSKGMPPTGSPTLAGHSFHQWTRGSVFPTSSMTYRKAAVERVGLFETNTSEEDWDYEVRTIHLCGVLVVPEVYATIRRLDDGTHDDYFRPPAAEVARQQARMADRLAVLQRASSFDGWSPHVASELCVSVKECRRSVNEPSSQMFWNDSVHWRASART